MADLSDFELINISGLPSGTAAGSNLLAQDDGSNTTKITINQAVAASQAMQQVNNKIGDTALPTTAQTLTGAIAEHEADLTALNSKFAYASGISLNTLTASGLYWVDSASDGPSFLAGGTSCLVIVIGTSTWSKQIATPVNNHGIRWERLRSSGTWGDWKLIRERVVVSANSTQTVTLPIWGVYLVSCTSHLWLVNIQGATQTPTVINLTGTTESNRTCAGVTNQNKITLGNTSTSNWGFGIITMV